MASVSSPGVNSMLISSLVPFFSLHGSLLHGWSCTWLVKFSIDLPGNSIDKDYCNIFF